MIPWEIGVDETGEGRFTPVSFRLRIYGFVGGLSILAGGFLAIWLGYEWVVHSTSHLILTIVAVVAILFGLQLVVMVLLSYHIIILYDEPQRQVEERQQMQG